MTREEMGVQLAMSCNQQGLLKMAVTICRNLEAARELVQDTCLRALENAEKFLKGKLMSWLGTLMRNLYINQIRDSMTSFSLIEENDVKEVDESMTPCYEDCVIEQRSELKQAFRNLRERDRHVLIMVAENCSIADIAKYYGVAFNTALSYVHRARMRAKQNLAA